MAIDVRLSESFRATVWLVGLTSFGLGFPLMWWAVRAWPKRLDEMGVTLRNGKRLAWSELSEVTYKKHHVKYGKPYLRIKLMFGKTRVIVVPHSLDPEKEIVPYLKGMQEKWRVPPPHR